MNKLTQKLAICLFSLSIAAGAQAAGFMKYDGIKGEANAEAGQTTGKRQHKPVQVIKSIDKNRPQTSPKSVKSDESESEPTSLLLPAIQKVH